MDTRLVIVEEAESTQDLAREAAIEGELEGFAIMTMNQTVGRGRLGRSWTSPPNSNLAMSILLRPTLNLDEMPLVGLIASIAVAETIESLGVPLAQLKWPNDVLVEGRKISGILTEARFVGSNFEFLILGIGLNVSSRMEDFPSELRSHVTSLYECTGITHNVDEIAKDLLKRIEIHYNRALQSGCEFVVPLWIPRWAHHRHRLMRNGLEGIAEDLTPMGALLLRTDEGQLIEITSGDVEPTASH